MEQNFFDPATLNPPMNIIHVQDAQGLARMSEYFAALPDGAEIGFDTETNVVPTFVDRKARTIQLGTKEVQYVIDLLPFAKRSGRPDAIFEQGNFTAPDWAKPVVDAITPILDSNRLLKVGTYLQFDCEVVLWNFGVYAWHLHDCNLAERCLYAGIVHFKTAGFWALDDMLMRYYNIKISKAEQKGFDMFEPLTEQQLMYAALDTRLVLGLRQSQLKLIEKHRLTRALQIENDAVPAFASMKLHGFKLNVDKWNALLEKIKEEHRRNVEKLDSFFLTVVPAKSSAPDVDALEVAWRTENNKEQRRENRAAYYAAKKLVGEMKTYEGQAMINYGSAEQLKRVLPLLDIPPELLPNTDDRTLSRLKKAYPVIQALTDYRETAKKISTYGENFLNHIHPVTGRIHSSIDQYGAATGRTSSSRPNIQNIPKEDEFRHSFEAWDEEWRLIVADYSGCELRIIAELSQEEAWVDAFNKGWDVHSVGAEILFEDEWKDAAEPGCAYYERHAKCSCKKHKILRDYIKSINFGIAYGMEADKLADELGIDIKKAKELLTKYRKRFAKVTKMLQTLGDSAKMNMESRTLSGRRRLYRKIDNTKSWDLAVKRLKEQGLTRKPTSAEVQKAWWSLSSSIEREGKNTPIQGTNADMIKLVLGCGYDEAGQPYLWHILRKYGAKLVNTVHDELVVEARKEQAEELQHVIHERMLAAGQALVNSVKMESETNITQVWSK